MILKFINKIVTTMNIIFYTTLIGNGYHGYHGNYVNYLESYLDGKGFKNIECLENLKKYPKGTELVIIYKEGDDDLHGYKYLISIDKNNLTIVSSNFKKYDIKISSIWRIYVSNIYKRKLIKHNINRYPVFINNYPDAIYYSHSKWDKMLYKQSRHYKQVCKHIKYFGNDL